MDVLRGINSNSIDLIYLDPPFNKKKTFVAPIGSTAEGASFKDIFREQDVKKAWIALIRQEYPKIYSLLKGVEVFGGKYNWCYLVYMAMRLIECYRVLKDTGSLYLHCDPTMSHYLKLLLDCIFGEKFFRNEIIWRRTSSMAKGSQFQAKEWGSNTDTILFYATSEKTCLHPLQSITKEEAIRKFPKINERGERYNTATPLYRPLSMGERPNLCYQWKGFQNPHPSGWRLSKKRLEEEFEKGNIVINGERIERRSYLKDYGGVPVGNLWAESELNIGSQSQERVGYPTQKPLALLERIIKASTNPGDIVLDPFCGCATACVASEKLNRQWIGIDVSKKAQELVLVRLKKEVMQTTLRDWSKKVINTGGIPVRSDLKYEKLPNVEVKTLLYGWQEGVCKGCEQHFRKENLEIDHIMPQIKGGSDDISNLQLLCGYCNRVKGSRPMEYLVQVLNETIKESKYCSY